MGRPSIVFLAPSAYCLGGVQVWLANLVPQLQQRGWRVTLALTAGRWHDVEAYAKAFPGLPLLSVANPSGSEEGRLRSIGRLLRELQPDLVAGVNIAALYPAVARLRRQGSFAGRTVMTLHAIQADLLAHLAAQRALIDAVIATNRLACQLCQREAGIAAERVLYAPYGVAVPPQPPAVAANRPGSALRLAWIGRLSQDQKRVLDLPEILRQLDRRGVDVRLSVAGDGPEAAALARALEPWIARGVVQLLGRLDGAELQRQVYAEHEALLITSSWETGPIVAWEAMAAGLAVVSSRYVGHRLEGALHDGGNVLLFPIGDAEAAAAALARVGDPALRAALVAAGHALVQSRYSEPVSFAAWERALEQALALPPLPLPPAPQPAASRGRLDRWIGAGAAEDLRRLLRIRFDHPEPGSEWPHTDRAGGDEALLLQRAAALDEAASLAGEVQR